MLATRKRPVELVELDVPESAGPVNVPAAFKRDVASDRGLRDQPANVLGGDGAREQVALVHYAFESAALRFASATTFSSIVSRAIIR